MSGSPSAARAHGRVLTAVWRGDPAQALHWAGRRRFWLWVFVVNAVVGGLAWMTVLPTVARTSSMVGRTVLGLDGSVSRPHVSWSQLALVGVAGLVVTFVVQVLRVASVRLTFAVREVRARAALPVATGAAVLTLAYLVVFVLCLVPVTSPWFFALVVAVAAIPTLTAEILVFVAMERTAPGPRSLLVPHAALTVAWAAAAAMLTALGVNLAPV